tara:strand:+ start:5455 stop:7131 length:1677 start_codon:yes stop_codon:yes gene_type:complete
LSNSNIIFGNEGRASLLSGANALTEVIKVTLGPAGRNVLIEQKLGIGQVTKDGATIASQISFSNKFVNIGANIIRQVAKQTKEASGDGATTATLLANSMLGDGIKAIAADLNAIQVKRGIDYAVSKVVEDIRKNSNSIESNAQIAQIATNTANGDSYIGKLIADAYTETGVNGEILIEMGQSTDDRLEIKKGMWFDRGYISRKFVTNEATLCAELKNPLILIYGKIISNLEGFMPFLDRATKEKRPLLIIAEDVENEALTTLVVNRQEGGLKVVAVKAPGFSEHRRNLLEDIAILTGGEVILGEPGLGLADASTNVLGGAKTVKVTSSKTSIIDGEGSNNKIHKRSETLQYILKNSKKEQEQKTLKTRIAKLSSSVAYIYVGGFSETEIKERREKFIKALNSVKSVLNSGYVVGGGVALINAIKSLDKMIGNNCDEFAGIQIVKNALKKPIMQISQNAGADSNQVISRVLESNNKYFGFDAKSLKYKNLVKCGIIDPTNIVCTSVIQAASIAGHLILSEVIISEKPVKKIPRHPFACKCSDHDHHHYPGDPYHEHHHT